MAALQGGFTGRNTEARYERRSDLLNRSETQRSEADPSRTLLGWFASLTRASVSDDFISVRTHRTASLIIKHEQ